MAGPEHPYGDESPVIDYPPCRLAPEVNWPLGVPGSLQAVNDSSRLSVNRLLILAPEVCRSHEGTSDITRIRLSGLDRRTDGHGSLDPKWQRVTSDGSFSFRKLDGPGGTGVYRTVAVVDSVRDEVRRESIVIERR